MILIKQQWSDTQKAWINEWQSDDGSDITANFDPTGAVGSTIMVIADKTFYIKNSLGQWQRFGSTEVVV